MSPTRPDPSAAIAAARLRKASALAEVLDRAEKHPATPVAWSVVIGAMSDEGRRAAERLAGVPESSDETWQMVADMLSARAAMRARFGSDPFEGLT